jgi:hypothetical protein
MKKFLLVLAAFAVFTGCAAKPGGLADNNEAEVIRRIAEVMPEACEYKGRAIIYYTEQYPDGTQDLATFQTVVDKECTNDMIMKVLGSFGMVEAELVVTHGQYRIFQKGEDVTSAPPVQLTAEDMILIEYYLNFPPPLPDQNSLMVPSNDHYMFIKNDSTYIFVNQNYFIDQIVTPRYQVNFTWEGNMLKGMSFYRDNVNVAVEFSEPWR